MWFLPLLPYCWGFSFALRCGLSFFGGIQHSPVDGGSAASCNFGVLAREDERMSFCSSILPPLFLALTEVKMPLSLDTSLLQLELSVLVRLVKIAPNYGFQFAGASSWVIVTEESSSACWALEQCCVIETEVVAARDVVGLTCNDCSPSFFKPS